MKDAAPKPVWPYVGMLVGLFCLTVISVGMWRIPASPAAAQSPAPGARAEGPATELPAEASAPRTAKPKKPSNPLQEFAVVPESVRVAPPIAQRVNLDFSLRDVPSLPTPASGGLTSNSTTPRIASLPRPNSQLTRQRIGLTPIPAHATGSTLGKRGPAWNQALSGWPYSIGLARRINELQEPPLTREWAEDILAQLNRLGVQDSVATPDVPVILADLRKLLEDAPRVAESLASRDEQVELYRAAYALRRRLEVWELIASLGHEDLLAASAPASRFDPDTEARVLANVALVLNSLESGSQWRAYLDLDRLEELRAMPTGVDRAARMHAARHTLRQLSSHRLTDQQIDFLAQTAFLKLEAMLRNWAHEPVDYLRLLREIEHYEHAGTASSAAHLAEIHQRLQYSDNPQLLELAKSIDTHYRNANARLALSADFINRLLPATMQFQEDVQDEILGARVVGRSNTTTQLRVVLIPDRLRWRFGLEAAGEVQSETLSRRGPVTFFNDGESRYAARKLMQVDRRGILVDRAEADAIADSELTGLETDFDALPLLNVLVRAIAVQQHDSQQDEARWEVRGKVASRASERLDAEVHARLGKAEDEFRTRILQPLRELDLDPVALDMRTTEQRLIARYRLAGVHQLAAHTPRPQAPGDSVLSLQLNQTAISNTIEQLKLNDRRFELREMFKSIAERFEADLEIPDDIPDDIYVRLAAKDPLVIECEDGLVHLTIRFAELERLHGESWQDFEIYLAYKPGINGLEATLNREGIIELRGDHLSFTDRFPLRAIFAKVFAKKRPLHLINPKLVERPDMQDLQVTQFVIRDGWLGLAVGPKKRPIHAYISDRETETRSDGPNPFR